MPSETPRRKRVLLIDDDPTQFACMRELFGLFRGEHYDLNWTPTFGEGLIALLSGKYCACLLDYQLGPRTGIELLEQASVAQCHTPIVLLTGWSGGDIDLEAINAGAVDYLVKGEINPRTLERALRYAIRIGQTMEALRLAATHDELTGLLNRRALDHLLSDELARAARFKRSFSLTLIDLDHFKVVNDAHGHQAGDQVLRHVASLLAGQVRSVDRVARYGGEEFAIVQIETDYASAQESARRLRTLLGDMPCVLPNNNLSVNISLSAGVASYPKHGNTVEQIFHTADRALYAAKAKGRNCVVGADELPEDDKLPRPAE
jgi:diguanylate cyclase (GGDEF)-like protein